MIPIHRRVVLPLLLTVFAVLACERTPVGDSCGKKPLPVPTFKIVEEVGVAEARPIQNTEFQGKLKEMRKETVRGKNDRKLFYTACRFQTTSGKTVRVTWGFPKEVTVDLQKGASYRVVYKTAMGFEGPARGLRVDDESGPVLLADDGAYGNALNDTKPFVISQEDAGCRNRKNLPGSLNNFYLVVGVGEKIVKLIHGSTKTLAYTRNGSKRSYDVTAVRSTHAVGDVRWTDAPVSFKSYIIVRN